MARFTKQTMLKEFEAMLQEMPYDSITVAELARRCEISPNTFYYHFGSLDDLLDDWLKAKMEAGLSAIPHSYTWKERLKYILAVIRTHEQLLSHLSESQARVHLEQYVFAACRPYIRDTVEHWVGDSPIPQARREELVQFMQYAFLGYFLRMLWDRIPDDIDQSVDWLYRQFYLYAAQALEA